jgi:hypothetical protein
MVRDQPGIAAFHDNHRISPGKPHRLAGVVHGKFVKPSGLHHAIGQHNHPPVFDYDNVTVRGRQG